MKRILLLIVFICCSLLLLQNCSKDKDGKTAATTFAISNVLGDNMVVQRDKPCQVWGTAVSGTKITVQASWNSAELSATADNSGSWIVSIPAASANANPQTIAVSANGKAVATLKNILIGDVWVCSGQSNMVKTLDSVLNSSAEIAAANYPQIRMATLASSYQKVQALKLNKPAPWLICSPQNAVNFSAIAYYFGQKLNTTLQVPIGLVVSAVAGSQCEEWVSDSTLTASTLLENYYGGSGTSLLYNGMIHPLGNLSIKGFIWYQGESNRYNTPPSNYTVLNSALISNWRALFKQGVLPFYLVQVAPFDIEYSPITNKGAPATADDYAFFREAQANVRAVTATGMAVTMDVGDSTTIHPKNKKPVGQRLALLALKNDYGQNVQCLGPQYSSYTVSSNVATISFVSGTAEGLNTINNAQMAQYFFVAGPDKIFRQAVATISGNQVIVTAPAGTPLPIAAIRYAFTNYPITNLQNSADLPMEPFRTDNWSK